MNNNARFTLRTSVSMFLILAVVLAGFALLLVRQDTLQVYETAIDRQVKNATAKKDLGELIVRDLHQVATRFYMILFLTEAQRQEQLLHETQQTLDEVYTALDVLSDGGTLTREFALNLADKDAASITIDYQPIMHQEYDVAVLTLRPQLMRMEEKIANTIAMTAQRNILIRDQQGGQDLLAIGLQLRRYAKGLHAQLERLTENANKLSYDANEELHALQSLIGAKRKTMQQVDTMWAGLTIFGVFCFIVLVYRQVVSTQTKLEHSVTNLQLAEHELQDVHAEVVALNSSLEQKVAIRTEELRRSELQWSRAFDAIDSLIFLHDKHGRITRANRPYLERANCTLAQALGQFYWDVFPKQAGPMLGCLSNSIDGETVSCTHDLGDLTIDEEIYRSQSFVINTPQGNYLYSLHLLEDVTQRRKSQHELAESDKRLREITNSMDEVLILLDGDLKILLLNDAALKAYGVDPDNYVGQPCHEVFWDCSEICENCPTVEVVRTGIVQRAMRYMPDGRILSRTIYPIKNKQEKITSYAVIASDVTAREKYIQELQRYEQILSTNTDLIAYYDAESICLAVNEVMAEYHGVTVAELAGKHARDIIGEERYNDFLTYSGPIFNEYKTTTVTRWITFKNYGLCHMSITLTPYVQNGVLIGIVARLSNITKQTEQETKLRLAAKVFESTAEGITVTDRSGAIQMVNLAFCHITGYSEAEVIGENPSILKSGKHDDEYYRQMWETLSVTGHWQGEIWNKRKSGEIYPEWLSISSLFDKDDNVSNYVATFSDLTKINNVVQKMEHQAHHHALTQLPNRLLLHARLDHSIQQAGRNGEQGAVLYIDLDNFKHINDSLGHAAGDEVLLKMGQRLQEHCRDVDTVAHLSGDEFVVVLDTVRSVHDAFFRAESLLDSLAQPLMVHDYELVITSSVGLAIFPDDGTAVDLLLKNADAAMHKAKEIGKSSCQLYSPELTESSMERMLLESDLRRALENEEFLLHYQPKVRFSDGKIVACEVLVRWQHREKGLIPPDKFIPISEEIGLIIPMGEWILRTACQQFVAWQQQGLVLGKMAVNLSGRQIQQSDLVDMVQCVLTETGCPATALELEITESFMMDEPEEAILVLQELYDLGIELSIDDFGTGHSSLSYLKRFPVHRLKIDRSFICDMEHDEDDYAIVQTIVAMGHSLDLKLTAEGIEDEYQRNTLAALGCDEAQGYLFSRPVPANEFAKML